MFKKILAQKEDPVGSLPEQPDGPAGYEVKNQCFHCRWLNRENPLSCSAFPDGIPNIILLGEFDHTAPFDLEGVSDGGLTFENDPDFDKL